MTINEAQADIRRAFAGGGPGVFVSSLVWFFAAWIEATRGTPSAFVALFFGGMLIFPLALFICRVLLRRKGEAEGNILGRIALESTIAMIAFLGAAWLFLGHQPEYVLPLSAIAVGTHYFVFRTVYGDILFWLLGALITAVGLLAIYPVVPLPVGTVLAVAILELAFAVVLFLRNRSEA
jgi:hypothetical protein